MKPSVDSFTDEVRVLNVIPPLSDWIYHHLWPNLLHRSSRRHFKSKSALTIVEKLVVKSLFPQLINLTYSRIRQSGRETFCTVPDPFSSKLSKSTTSRKHEKQSAKKGPKTQWQHVVWLPRSDVTIGKKGHCVQGGDVGRRGVGELLPRLCETLDWVSNTGEGW